MSGMAGGLDAVASFEATWRRLQVRKRWLTLLYGSLFAVALIVSAWVGEFNPIRLIEGLPRIHEYVAKTLPVLTLGNFWGDLSEWFYGLPKWLGLLWETILIAYIATLLGTAGALGLCFHAAQNTRRGTVSYWITRRVFEVARTIPELVFALIFVFAFGIGPLAGILAIALDRDDASCGTASGRLGPHELHTVALRDKRARRRHHGLRRRRRHRAGAADRGA